VSPDFPDLRQIPQMPNAPDTGNGCHTETADLLRDDGAAPEIGLAPGPTCQYGNSEVWRFRRRSKLSWESLALSHRLGQDVTAK